MSTITANTGNNTAGSSGLFDASMYDQPELRLPKVDGRNQQRIAVKFTGTVYLDRTDPADVALYRDIEAGRNVELTVQGTCSGFAAKFGQDTDGNLDEITGERTVKIHTVYPANR